MQFISLGQVDVAVAGTPVQLTSTQDQANSITITALTANAGDVYVGTSDLDNSSMVGVLAILDAGESWPPGWPLSNSVNDINPSELYLDCENGQTDGVVASITVK